MINLPERPSSFWDVDDTLVTWRPVTGMRVIEINVPGQKNVVATVTPHDHHIEQLKEHARRQHLVVVWSAGGAVWAEAVVRALGLAGHVDLVCAKPTWIYDDKPASDWLGDDKRSFLDLVTGKRIV